MFPTFLLLIPAGVLSSVFSSPQIDRVTENAENVRRDHIARYVCYKTFRVLESYLFPGTGDVMARGREVVCTFWVMVCR